MFINYNTDWEGWDNRNSCFLFYINKHRPLNSQEDQYRIYVSSKDKQRPPYFPKPHKGRV